MRVQADTRWGRWSVLDTDRYIGWSLLAYGEYSPFEWRFLASLVQRGSLVLDVGCNIGAIGGPLAATGAVVRGIEPQAQLAELADANMVEAARRPGGGLATVTLAACGAETGTIQLPQLDYATENNFGGLAVGQGEVTVPMTTVDAVVGDDRPVLIKADVEGMELEVLRGADRTIERCRPLLYLEADRAAAVPPLLDHLLARRYRWHWHRPPLFAQQNYRGLRYCLEHLRGILSHNVIAVPAEQAVASWEGRIAMGIW